MITDSQTSYVIISDLFHKWYPNIAGEVFRTLAKHNIQHFELKGTKDVWCRDFLPIQGSESKYVQFTFDPSYSRL